MLDPLTVRVGVNRKKGLPLLLPRLESEKVPLIGLVESTPHCDVPEPWNMNSVDKFSKFSSKTVVRVPKARCFG